MNANVAIQVLPKSENDRELVRIVDEVIDYIASTGLSYYVGPCETSIEGDYDQLMEIIKECQHVAIRAGAKEVSAYVKISYRPEGEVLTIDEKVSKHHK
ncbi:MAG: thiamine-binding protein [Lachnospiraceae bacterium]|nr:thiamine-binding protein [Lachnospiraceae bacterium]